MVDQSTEEKLDCDADKIPAKSRKKVKKSPPPKKKSPKKPVKRDSNELVIGGGSGTPSSAKQAVAKVNQDLLELEIKKFYNMTCELCSMAPGTFETFADIKKHYRELHNQKGYLMCCGRALTKRHRVVEHMQFHLNPQAFQCGICTVKRTFKSKVSLKEHSKLIHNVEGREYKCDECPSVFSNPHKLEGHIFRKHTSDEDKHFVCDICNKR